VANTLMGPFRDSLFGSTALNRSFSGQCSPVFGESIYRLSNMFAEEKGAMCLRCGSRNDPVAPAAGLAPTPC